jgi:hypothetical protein
MSHQIVSWLRNTVEVLSLITDNRHLFRRIVWELSGINFPLEALICAWRLFLRGCQHGKPSACKWVHRLSTTRDFARMSLL